MYALMKSSPTISFPFIYFFSAGASRANPMVQSSLGGQPSPLLKFLKNYFIKAFYFSEPQPQTMLKWKANSIISMELISISNEYYLSASLALLVLKPYPSLPDFKKRYSQPRFKRRCGNSVEQYAGARPERFANQWIVLVIKVNSFGVCELRCGWPIIRKDWAIKNFVELRHREKGKLSLTSQMAWKLLSRPSF